MKRLLAIAAAVLVLTGCVADIAGVETPAAEKPQLQMPEDVCRGMLFVKFDPYVADIIEEQQAQTRAAGTSSARTGMLSVDEVLERVGTFDVERVFPVDIRHEERTREAELHQWYVVRFDEEISPAEVAEQLSALGEIRTVNFNRTIKRAYSEERKAVPISSRTLEIAQRMQAATRAAAEPNMPDDALLRYQWDIVNRGVLYDHDGNIVSDTPADYPVYDGSQEERPGVIAGADVQCEDAWALTTGDESIIVAILDEGIDVEHEDLKASMWCNEGEIYRSHEDNDGNGYAGDYHGYNFARDSGVISADDQNDTGHGTHVAGVIAAQRNNGKGIAGIAGGDGGSGGVKIMSCQIFSGIYVASILAEVRAIKYAADNGAVILQCSWGYMSSAANPFDWGSGTSYADDEEWATYNPLEKAALDYFVHNAGSPNGVIEGGLAIFAGGNEYAPAAGYPGAYSAHIAVAATAADYTPAVYTNYGTGISISAPGGDYDYYGYLFRQTADEADLNEGKNGTPGAILSTLPKTVSESGYGYMEGTSMACPHVSGVAALGLSYAANMRRHFTAGEFRELLLSTSVPIDDYLTGTKRYYQYVTDLKDVQTKSMSLASYKGRMGRGQVSAARLLAAIDGSGIEMRFPNLYIPLGSSVAVHPSLYFDNGRTLTYTLTIADGSIASGEYDAASGTLTVSGKAEGTTTAVVRASSGEEQSFTVTVRRNAAGQGWL